MDIMATPNEKGAECISQWIYGSVYPSSLMLAAGARLMVCLRSSVGRPGRRRQLQR
ncbi:hypothetical protein [Candidatus Regiella insecticola]|uniref:hypothetical protein n=1 Tax=Candidatus Regiella insecticola TaxID=138073 RepID=UPI001C3FD5D1|nr:hypothetical protein [Candidatus Regiella insecticola]